MYPGSVVLVVRDTFPLTVERWTIEVQEPKVKLEFADQKALEKWESDRAKTKGETLRRLGEILPEGAAVKLVFVENPR
jgi:hypothetical protein